MIHTIEFVLFPDALGLDITGPLEVFNTANAVLERKPQGRGAYRFRFAATERQPVQLSSGLEIVPNATFSADSPVDTLLVPGGSGARQAIGDPVIVEYVRRRSRQAKRTLSVCNGAFILAEAGLLDGKSATTHWLTAAEFAQRYPRVKMAADAIFTQDDNIYTSAGVTAGIDLALAIVEADLGLSLALEVSRLLVLYFRRPGAQSQFSASMQAQQAAGRRFAKLHQWLVQHLDLPISVDKMAEQAAMSPRNFARVFKNVTGMTPIKFLETLRLDRARELMTAGNQRLDRIAEKCGFGREERLRRAFLRRFAITPSQYRLHFNPEPGVQSMSPLDLKNGTSV